MDEGVFIIIVLFITLGLIASELPCATDGPASAPASEASPGSGTCVCNPLAGESFRMLRERRVTFGRGGLPPRDTCA